MLRQRAAKAHQSLQEYLLGLLVREASSPTLDEFSIVRPAGPAAGSASRKHNRRFRTTVIVTDAAVLVVALLDDGHDGTTARDRLRGNQLAAPRTHRPEGAVGSSTPGSCRADHGTEVGTPWST